MLEPYYLALIFSFIFFFFFKKKRYVERIIRVPIITLSCGYYYHIGQIIPTEDNYVVAIFINVETYISQIILSHMWIREVELYCS